MYPNIVQNPPPSYNFLLIEIGFLCKSVGVLSDENAYKIFVELSVLTTHAIRIIVKGQNKIVGFHSHVESSH